MRSSPALTVYHLIRDDRLGHVFGLVTARAHIDVRVTPSGLVRLGEVQKGRPAYADAEEKESDAEDMERLRWAWETASDPDHPDREQAIICLESYVGRANGWFGGDRDEDDQ